MDVQPFLTKLASATAGPPAESTLVLCDEILSELARGGVEGAALVEARALFAKAKTLALLGRWRESREIVGELVRRHEHDEEPAVRRVVGRALFGLAKDRLRAGDADRRGLIVEYRHILHIAERAPEVGVLAAEASFHLALTHAKIAIERNNDEHREKAMERFLDTEKRFGASQDPETAYWATRCAWSHALLLPLDAATRIYEGVFARYALASLPLRTLAAETLLRWADRCMAEGQKNRGNAVIDRLLESFPEGEGRVIRAHRAAAERLRES